MLNHKIYLMKIYCKFQFQFSRKLKNFPSLKSRQIEHQESKQIEGSHEHKQEERTKPTSKSIDDEFIAKCRLSVQHLPEKLLQRANQIFSKFPAKSIRKYAEEYQKLYHTVNGCEKPMDYNRNKPFINSEEIFKENKNLLHLHSAKISKEDMEKKIDEKKEKNEKKKIDLKFDVSAEGEKTNNSDNFQLPSIVYTQNLALAYLLKKMPRTFGVGCRVLSEIKYRLPQFKPKNFLDFGAGMGSGSWAFHDLFPESEHIIACEPSRVMRKIGKHLTKDIDKIIWMDFLSKTVNYEFAYSFDMVYCAYVFEEIKNSESRILVLETLWQKVSPNGVIIFIETGSPKGFRFIYDIRRWIISKDRKEANIIAPCPHHDKCPLSDKNTWCHFDQPIANYPNQIFPKLAKEDTIFYEKFSFIIIKKGEIINKKDTPASRSFEWDRIVRPIMKKAKHKIIDVCNKEGELERIIVAKSHEGNTYKESKNLRWGDLWRFPKRIPNKYRKEGDRFSKRLW